MSARDLFSKFALDGDRVRVPGDVIFDPISNRGEGIHYARGFNAGAVGEGGARRCPVNRGLHGKPQPHCFRLVHLVLSFFLSFLSVLPHGFVPGTDGRILGQAIAAYNQTHPDRPY